MNSLDKNILNLEPLGIKFLGIFFIIVLKKLKRSLMALFKNHNSTYRELEGMSCRMLITGRSNKFCQYEKLLKVKTRVSSEKTFEQKNSQKKTFRETIISEKN